ncbi:MAG: FkbM family methyltransferase [Cyanosarcina radialis HA8281-LM2]|jgi:FkbM family methyltransferase|nr:FkbM family methyltransferase [Cyanosarcina radialis HA8281-LM2]
MNEEQQFSRAEGTKLRELEIRVLHSLLYEAIGFTGFAVPYISFVRALRERLHPVGTSEIRLAEMNAGLKFQVDLGDRLGCDIYYGYYQEYFDSQLFFSLIDPGCIVLDIGANFGYYTTAAARLTGIKGSVIACEPNEEAYKLLQANVEINGVRELVRCYRVCAGAEDGETDFYVSEESSFSSMSSTGRAKLRQKVTVPVRSLDSLLLELGLERIDAMKIDVEGYEFAVLRGAIATLKISPNAAIMMEVSAKNLDEQRRGELISVLTEIYQLGFRGWVVDSNPEMLKLLNTPQEAVNLGSANVFLTQGGSEREQRLIAAYKDLQTQAFTKIAREIGLPERQLLHRHISDPLRYSNLYGAFLDRLLRDRNATIDYSQSRIEQIERQLGQREEEIRQRDEEISQRDRETAQRDEVLANLERESQERLAAISQRDEAIAKLQAEVEFLKQELDVPPISRFFQNLKLPFKLKKTG